MLISDFVQYFFLRYTRLFFLLISEFYTVSTRDLELYNALEVYIFSDIETEFL